MLFMTWFLVSFGSISFSLICSIFHKILITHFSTHSYIEPSEIEKLEEYLGVYLSRSAKKRISSSIKKIKPFSIFPNTDLSNSLLSFIFLSIISLLRTLFAGHSLVPYENFENMYVPGKMQHAPNFLIPIFH